MIYKRERRKKSGREKNTLRSDANTNYKSVFIHVCMCLQASERASQPFSTYLYVYLYTYIFIYTQKRQMYTHFKKVYNVLVS